MKRTLALFVLFAVSIPVHSAADMEMWGCAPLGERRTLLYVVDRGSRSYVKIGGQRANARVTAEETVKRWSWGNNAIALSTKTSRADYFESGTLKAKFQCKRVNR